MIKIPHLFPYQQYRYGTLRFIILTSKVETARLEGDRAEVQAARRTEGKNAMGWRF